MALSAGETRSADAGVCLGRSVLESGYADDSGETRFSGSVSACVVLWSNGSEQGVVVMSIDPGRINDFHEPCERCGQETPHRVRIEVRSNTPNPSPRSHNREPIRVATCGVCGNEATLRMSRL